MDHRYRVGIIGGGQLARMMQQTSIRLGIKTHLLAESSGSSTAQVIPLTTVGDYTDLDTLTAFARQCDVITFNHGHVPTGYLRALEDRVMVKPGPEALEYAQDKTRIRGQLSGLGVPCPHFVIYRAVRELIDFGQEQSWPIIVKIPRGNYSGKGVWKLCGPSEAATPFETKPDVSAGEEMVIVVEEFTDFERESSVITVRSSYQAMVYPVSETTQRDGVYVEMVTPTPELPGTDATALQELALYIAGKLGVIGVLAVELVQVRDGRIVVDELAMHPHNTSRRSIEGARANQFANHIRAVLDLPLGSPKMTSPVAVTADVLEGTEKDLTETLRHVFAKDRELTVHLYGKQVRPDRKVGHVTACGTDLETVMWRARHVAHCLMGETDEWCHYPSGFQFGLADRTGRRRDP